MPFPSFPPRPALPKKQFLALWNQNADTTRGILQGYIQTTTCLRSWPLSVSVCSAVLRWINIHGEGLLLLSLSTPKGVPLGEKKNKRETKKNINPKKKRREKTKKKQQVEHTPLTMAPNSRRGRAVGVEHRQDEEHEAPQQLLTLLQLIDPSATSSSNFFFGGGLVGKPNFLGFLCKKYNFLRGLEGQPT